MSRPASVTEAEATLFRHLYPDHSNAEIRAQLLRLFGRVPPAAFRNIAVSLGVRKSPDYMARSKDLRSRALAKIWQQRQARRDAIAAAAAADAVAAPASDRWPDGPAFEDDPRAVRREARFAGHRAPSLHPGSSLGFAA